MDSKRLQIKDLRMLFFSSHEERIENKLILREDEELKDFAHIAYSGFPIVHAKEIPMLRKKGLKFKVSKPITYLGLTPKQRKLLGERKAFFVERGSLGIFLIRRPPPAHLFSE